jgi:hypothetical protein
MKKAWGVLKGKYQVLNTKYPFFAIVAANGFAECSLLIAIDNPAALANIYSGAPHSPGLGQKHARSSGLFSSLPDIHSCHRRLRFARPGSAPRNRPAE